MFVFTMMVRDWFTVGPSIYLFAIFSGLIWLMWITKTVISLRYRPWTTPHTVGSSVLIPVVDEPEDLFRDVLRRIVDQGPDEVIVVINGRPNPTLERVCEDFPTVRVRHTWVPGKRHALWVANRLRRHEIAVLVDSDTLWTDDNDGTLVELLKPFADPNVGGVTTRQRILDPERSFITRWADWLENTRGLYSMPMQSVLRQVGCLPGRTIAFRGDVLDHVMNDFMTQKYLGTFLEVSDDRTLTNLTLKAGYATVYQSTATCYTDAPLQLRKLYKQQLRWARGSTYNSFRMMPWYAGHAPVLGFFFLMDIVLPFLLLGGILGWIVRAINGTGVNFYQPILQARPGWHGIAFVIALAVVSSWASMAVRQYRHWREPGKHTDLLRMPLFILFSTAFLMPIRILGFFKLAHNAAWGTRAGAFAGGAAATPHVIQLPHQGGVSVSTPTPTGGTTLTLTDPTTVTEADLEPDLSNPPQPNPPRWRRNPLALIPYAVGFTTLAVLVLISTS